MNGILFYKPRRLSVGLLLPVLVFGSLLQAAAQQQATVERDDGQAPGLTRVQATVPSGTRWYHSNASGMMLGSLPSQLAALRAEYALALSPVSRNQIPPMLLPYFVSSYSMELRTLFNEGEVTRKQWIFRDTRGTTRINASGTEGLFLEEHPQEGRGFIEVYNADHRLMEERLFQEGTESLSQFTYSRGMLIRAETWIREPVPETKEAPQGGPLGDRDAEDESEGDAVSLPVVPLPAAAAAPWGPGSPPDITDYYRYTRSASLRAIERVYHSGSSVGDTQRGAPQGEDTPGEDSSGEISRRRISFPSIGPIFPKEPEFENPGIAHSSEFLDDVVPPGGRVIYSTDNRGRVLSEKRLDEEGTLLGEMVNNWTGDRLESVFWKSGDDEWLIEYDYDERGNRIRERNYNNGVLERSVHTEGDREVEELFMNGRLILRATWEDGRKISEERIRGTGN